MTSPTLLSYAFRPFFLLAAAWAALGLASWYALLLGISWPGAPPNIVFWHIHEMVFGFVGAAMAGFLLTAVATWTNRPPVRGVALGILVVAWVSGRIVSALSGDIAPAIVTPLELSFPVLLFVLFAREVFAAQNRRNYVLVFLVGLFPLVDLAYLLGFDSTLAPTLSWSIYFLPHLVVLLITIIGGRITPAFTGNWLRARGVNRAPSVRPWLDITALVATLAVGLADSLLPLSVLTGVLALLTAFVHGLRLSGWCGLATLKEPLLFILHVGYGWIVIGYLMLAGASFLEVLPSSSAFHAITVGAIGTMVLAVMSRVSLGHTGRELHADRLTLGCYVAITIATLARVVAPLSGDGYSSLIAVSAVAWITAFVGFFLAYFGILTTPRVDQRN